MRAKLVTVFSDASVKGGQAGFGFWVKSDVAQVESSGDVREILERTTDKINEAELAGIIAACRAARDAHDGPIILVIQCDSMAALGAMRSLGIAFAKNSPLKCPPRQRMTDTEHHLLSKYRLIQDIESAWLKHIKGHTGARCGRSKINRLVDKLAAEGRNKKP